MEDGWAIFDSGPGAVRRGIFDLINTSVPSVAGKLAEDDVISAFRRMRGALDAAPPAIRRIRAHHSVPYGRAYRQWNTRGELEVWANRGEIEDLPRRSYADT